MPLGFDRNLNVVNAGDTAELYATITDLTTDEPIPQDELIGVSFVIQQPDGTEFSDDGEIQGDGLGFYRFEDTGEVGDYKAVATFERLSGEIRSIRSDFEVIDPFNPPVPTDEDIVAQLVWSRLEDVFDSEEGGPWLQDVTMDTFKREKMTHFIADALFDINQQNPPTNVNTSQFILNSVPNSDSPLLVEGVLIAVIRHLIRSYTEQPQPQGGQIVYEDRRDYQQRWQTVLQVEMERYQRWVALWKRSYLQLGASRVLVSSKAGRLMPGPMRTRYVGRGYW